MPTTGTRIPFFDLKRQYADIKPEIDTAITKVLESGQFILGEELAAFETEFARYVGAKHAFGVGSGTDALFLSLLGMGIGPGDEVITVANTYIATALTISHAGAKPVLVDIDEKTFNMNPAMLEKAITKRTKAIVPVHLFGLPADIPTKPLGAYGDGGMVTTNDDVIADKIRLLRNYGETTKYHHAIKGFNSRLDELQAAVLRVKMKHIDQWISMRRKNAELYTEALHGADVILPSEPAGYKHVYYLYVVRSKRRDALQKHLASKGIGTMVHYPIPIHMQQAYNEIGWKKGDFPAAERSSSEILSLPMYPELRKDEIEDIAATIRGFG
ncbi:MAG: DegT/DnrJ/EryC1/StrS family aminotransferase [Candidatus Aenigmarchaeota archaeon]|nr:DegT/DnrJ/EryC1/StrS family aminotransferase [Candidatus Aenigmarchaeota archaeon]